MSPDETTDLISVAGGDLEFARLLGIEKEPGIAQRVNNWKRRGIPPAVVLAHYQTIQELKLRSGNCA